MALRAVVQGSSVGGGQTSILFQDEGSNLGTQGTVDTIDFTGAGVAASRIGNKVTVNVTSGGGSSATADEVVFGTGTGVTSSPSFQWIETDKRLRINSASPTSNHRTATPGSIQIYGAQHNGAGDGATVQIRGGQGGVTSGNGGAIEVRGGSGSSAGSGTGGAVDILAGISFGGAGSAVTITGGDGAEGAGGNVNITAGAGGTGTATAQNGGNVVITAGAPVSGGTAGVINLVIPSAGALQLNGSGGVAGQFLQSNGPSAAPTWVAGGGVTDGDKGDITVSGGGTVWNIDAGTIGLTELSATGTPSVSTYLRGDNTWATPSATVADGDKGDITVSGGGTVWNIDAGVVGITELSATGTPDATTFLRGDNTWAAASGSGLTHPQVMARAQFAGAF